MPAELLQSPVYTVGGQVTTDGLVTKTVLRSPFGDFEAEGPGMVAVRAAEIQALDVLSKTETFEIFQQALQASTIEEGSPSSAAVGRDSAKPDVPPRAAR